MIAEIVSNGMLSLPSSLAVVGIVPGTIIIVFLGVFVSCARGFGFGPLGITMLSFSGYIHQLAARQVQDAASGSMFTPSVLTATPGPMY